MNHFIKKIIISICKKGKEFSLKKQEILTNYNSQSVTTTIEPLYLLHLCTYCSTILPDFPRSSDEFPALTAWIIVVYLVCCCNALEFWDGLCFAVLWNHLLGACGAAEWVVPSTRLVLVPCVTPLCMWTRQGIDISEPAKTSESFQVVSPHSVFSYTS